MFTTFGTSLHSSHNGLSANDSVIPKAASPPKRSQVARACDWCRAYRIKCDGRQQCKSCESKGRKCSLNGKIEVRTFSQAIKEIERLKMRVKELEEQLKLCESAVNEKSPSSSIPLGSTTSSLPANLDPFREHGGNRRYWECIQTRTARSHQRQCYGPASSFYFIGRINSYLGMELQEPHLNRHIQLNSASRSITSPLGAAWANVEEASTPAEAPFIGDYLSRMQEEYFLNLFWQSYHCSYPVLDEKEFRKHYDLLWETGGKSRKSSALVDIVIAICRQYGTTFIVNNEDGAKKMLASGHDPTIAGRMFYRRCQALLTDELEGPSIATVQCHIFSVVYLLNASFHNMAHTTLALAVRTGIILGLHLEPPEDLPKSQRELHKRLWWILYSLEMKTCMELGRPLAANISQVTCSLPSDDHEVGLLNSGLSFDNITCLTFNLQYIKLILTARAIYVTFYRKCTDVLGRNGQKSLYNDHQALESCAEFLLLKMEFLRIWLKDVAGALMTKRKGAGEPFSADRSSLDVKPFAPFWLQRQRLLLELLYHNIAMSLYRPFICFSRNSSSATPFTEGNSILCLNHAITMTRIIHQILEETDILSGWHEIFQWQWNAFLSLVGYILAYPIGPSTASARKALITALAVFDLLAKDFTAAISAANIARDLCAKVDIVSGQLRESNFGSQKQSGNDEDLHNSDNHDWSMFNLVSSRHVSAHAEDFRNPLTNSAGLNLGFDSFNGLESIYTSGCGVTDTWDLGQNQQSDIFLPWLTQDMEAPYELTDNFQSV